ncbi:putative baseplate assembly protein [Paenibacillus tepidiphilus]|uniref:putative baseplate assembly protein n=1 Tax=Paenibacillus tepidiphilus TaxID=2608683 RepID=UPI00123ABA98|nr:putative baseplate assembly protein [Paenibacillus tepidiphilus]
MPNSVPMIDSRNQEQLVTELRSLIYRYCAKEWSDLTELAADKKAEAMIHIFTDMLGKVTERLNKAPEKHLISFLNMVGISPTPPRAAKAPLLFALKDDAAGTGTIPAGSKVSAQPASGGELIFETDKDLTVIRPRLVRAASLDPLRDKWSSHDILFSDEAAGGRAELFTGDAAVIHRLYLGHEQLLGFGEAGSRLTVYLNKPEDMGGPEGGTGRQGAVPLAMDWFCFDKDGNAVRLTPAVSREWGDSIWGAAYQFDGLSGVQAKTVTGYDAAGATREWNSKWLYAELRTELSSAADMPDIEGLHLALSIASPAPLQPDTALGGGAALDLGKDYYPFGEKPKVNDTFYIACGEAFSKEGGEIALHIALSDPAISPLPDTKSVQLSWEYWDGAGWDAITDLQPETQTGIGEGTGRPDLLTASGIVRFRCPGIRRTELNGEDNYWIRLRITGGHYGEEAKYGYKDEEVQVGDSTVTIAQLQYTEATFKPPSLQKLSIAYQYTLEDCPEVVLTENNFTFAEKTRECREEGLYFKPFYPCTEQSPTLYMAFDENPANLPVSLFFPLTGEQLGVSPVIAWEYWDGRRWLTLPVSDDTRGFTRREMLQFAAPADIGRRALLGTEHYWIRARLEEGSFEIAPQIDAVYSNVVWAHNVSTIAGELPGSSNGEENQSFQLSKTPVLPGQRLWVREASGQAEWSLWEEVDAFSLSEADGRHYMLDRTNGTISFGDGRNGMIPPMGVDNLKCDYQHGGGAAGNVAAGSITRMWDSFDWLDGVTNPVAADGGFDQEGTEQAIVRGPHSLKSWDRGVTAEDIEWLVREGMPRIAKVKCLGARNRDLEFVPGMATVIVVPEKDEPKPVPSQELLSEIEAYLLARTAAILGSAAPRIAVTGPDYVRIGIEANAAFTSVEQRKVAEGRMIDGLKQFFHPLYGGQYGEGWALGNNLYVSEVYALLKNTPGVDYISDIAVKASLQCYTLGIEPLESGPYRPAVEYPKYSAVRMNDGSIQMALAEGAAAGSKVKALMVKGFRENTEIQLRYRNYSPVKLRVLSIDGDILECRTWDGEELKLSYPEGSDIEYVLPGDAVVRSYIMNELPAGADTFSLKIAVFEPGDIVYLSRNDEYINTTPLKLSQVSSENIFLEENELIYGGTHLINKMDAPVFAYLLDKQRGTLHDLTAALPECALEEIRREDRKYITGTAGIPGEVERCPYCSAQATRLHAKH